MKPIDYEGQGAVVLAVDTSYIVVGYYIYQEDKDNPKKHYFAKFGSITLSEQEARYSQPKRELYGLKRALEENKKWLIGVRKLIVETDAQFIGGMLHNPDMMPNAVINRWIEQIGMYHFTLRHKAGKTFGPDGLSRRHRQPNDPEPPVTEPEGGDPDGPVEIVIADPDDPPLRPIKEFFDQIDNQKGFTQQVVDKVFVQAGVGPAIMLADPNETRPAPISEFVDLIEPDQGHLKGIARTVDCFAQELEEADIFCLQEQTHLQSYLATNKEKLGPERCDVVQQLVNVLTLPDEEQFKKKTGPYPEKHRTDSACNQDKRIPWVLQWFKNKQFRPPGLKEKEYKQFLRFANRLIITSSYVVKELVFRPA